MSSKDLKLVLVGEKADPDYWREIEAEIQTLNLKDRVVHVPACPREELIAVYHNAAAFVHPSLAETCSFPLLEALAMGLPIAAANTQRSS
ncbi:MAG: glycosyltransferase [Acidobacteria bacterium]|nr:glycosyltransferase [Acidobacteriota bacterium]